MVVFHKRHHYLIFFVAHLAIGAFVASSSIFAFAWGVVSVAIGLVDIVIHRNGNERAACWAAYVTGMEVVLRMQEAFITYEASKYFVILLLTIGLLVGGGLRGASLVFVLLLSLLLPAVVLSDIHGDAFRRAVLFNLSGPITLIVAGIYFYNRMITRQELNSILVYFVMPIVCTVIVLQFSTPDFSSIRFSAESNFETSGGFGPNQVSTLMGCGVFIVLLAIILQLNVTGYRIVDILLLSLFSFRGLITFSRGGMLSVVMAMACFIMLSVILDHPLKERLAKYVVIIASVAFVVWSYSWDITGGQIENRYLGKSAKGKEGADLTSGRSNLLNDDYEIFLENPLLGSGVGMSKLIREQKHGYLAASHSEFGRLLAEHGSLGILFMLVLFAVIVTKMISLPALGKMWMLTLVLYALLTINHAAMRTALPGFVFGLAFILLVPDSDRKPK